MNINGFKGAVRDVARANRFVVRLSRLGGTLEFLCKGTEVPNDNVEAMDVNYQGRTLKYTGDRIQADWTITVYGDNTMSIYKACQDWLEQINGKESNVSAAAPDVWEQATIQLLGRDDSVILEKTLIDVFPTDLGSLSLDWSSNNTPLEFTITFAYNTTK